MHKLIAVQKIPVSVEKAWELFSSPSNLEIITPASLKFKVLSPNVSPTVYAGQLIEYRVSPLLGIPLFWKTEITDVKENEFFIDEQRKGPYTRWHHEHYFKSIEGGVEMTDLVEYKNPLGVLGKWANEWFVRKKLRDIFNYRFYKVEELLGKWESQDPLIRFE